MSTPTATRGWFAPRPPTVAVEVTSRRVTVASVAGLPGRPAVAAYASEPLPAGVVTPGLAGPNITSVESVATSLQKALESAGLRGTRRAALVVPDAIARVSFVTLAQVPARPAELETLLRWQVRKSVPFPIDEAMTSHVVAHRDAEGVTFGVVVARRSVVAEYEAVTDAVGIHAGIVDLTSFNVVNLVLASGTPAGDSLVVSLAPEGATLVILRGAGVMFYRHRASGADDEPLGALVHQTAMYHADRLGGSRFQRIWLAGGGDAAARSTAAVQIEERLGVTMQAVDVRPAVAVQPAGLSALDIDALAAPVGLILRGGRAA
jgi:Tfp pilus assembly PilM family ATPase